MLRWLFRDPCQRQNPYHLKVGGDNFADHNGIALVAMFSLEARSAGVLVPKYGVLMCS